MTVPKGSDLSPFGTIGGRKKGALRYLCGRFGEACQASNRKRPTGCHVGRGARGRYDRGDEQAHDRDGDHRDRGATRRTRSADHAGSASGGRKQGSNQNGAKIRGVIVGFAKGKRPCVFWGW